MATDLSAVVFAGLRCSYSAAGETETLNARFDTVEPTRLEFGTGSNQANAFWSDERSLAASANHTMDLRGALANKLGETVQFATVKAIYIFAHVANAVAHDIAVGAGANPFLAFLGGTTPTLKLAPGASVCLLAPSAGWAVTGGANDDLMVTNLGGVSTVNYDICIIGVSA